MARPRFFLTGPIPDADPVPLLMSDRDRHHLSLVLRMQPGEEIVAVEPDGAVWALRLFAVSPDTVIAGRIERLPATSEPHVVLVQGVGKADKTSEVVQGAIEVGVSAVWPVITARSIVKLDAEKRRDRGIRWRRVAEATAKQSQRAFVPEVSDPAELRHVLPLVAGCDVALVAWEDAANAPGVREALAAAGAREGSRVALVVGPEGGLSAEEVAELEAVGAIPVSLGATILRTETAGVVGAALVVHELGGLGNRGL